MNETTLKILLQSPRPLRAEKDLLECLIIKSLFSDDEIRNTCIVTGSSSTTKMYRFGNRIGNDIDLAYTDFYELPDTRSMKQLNKFKTRFKDFVFGKLSQKVATAIKPIGKFEIYTDRDLRNRSLKYRLETGLRSSPELHLYYQSTLCNRYKGHILIEFIPRRYSSNMIDFKGVTPCFMTQPITPVNIPTINYAQTFWDKCYALHVISQLGAIRSGLAHHYYDIGCMAGNVDILGTKQCLKSVVEYQQKYTARQVSQPTSLNDIQLMPDIKTLQILSQDYSTIRTRFIGEPENWSNIVNKIQLLNIQIHQLDQQK